ncbi:hypothetical protein AA313_de0205795 [Arthrobotrys entomopaga]|nr:hypothetical protein AA313_de0205795 [Arthrobotrys entomopaga]
MLVARPWQLKLIFGAIFFASVSFTLYYFEAVSQINALLNPLPSTKQDNTYAIDSYDEQRRINPLTLDVEQIEADYPMGYHNPRIWFYALPIPGEKPLLPLVSEEERKLLPKLGAQALLSKRQQKKIESFYGINRKGSWQDHIESLDDEGLAPLTVRVNDYYEFLKRTKWAQKYIYDHQHPKNCTGKKFYILSEKARDYGLGAAIRVIFRELELAISFDRILVLDPKKPPGGNLLHRDCGRHRGRASSIECIVEDITSCAAYATEENSVTELEGKPPGANKYVPPLPALAMITYMKETGLELSGAVLRYWWHAQMYAYILRPNEMALQRIREMRMNKTLHSAASTKFYGKDGKVSTYIHSGDDFYISLGKF